jgi:hypothetical protein
MIGRMIAMNARDRRALLIGIVGMSSIVGVGRGVPSLLRWQRARVDAAAEARSQLRYEQAAARLLPSIEDSLRARRARLIALDSVLFVAAIPSEASAQLAAVLSEYAEGAQVKVTAVQLRQDSVKKSTPLVRVGARLTGAADVTGLATLLHALETDETPLAVRELTVTQPEPAGSDTRPEILRFEMLVEGLARMEKPKS